MGKLLPPEFTKILLDTDIGEIYREKSERSLLDFMKFVWRAFKGEELMINWHHDAIAEHLEAAMRFEIKQLIINIPPRHTKSLLTSVCLTPWWWIHEPSAKFMYSSYATKLSYRDSVVSRRIIQSPQYIKYWGNRYGLTGDKNTKSKYENDRSGFRIATSVGGGVIGDGGDYNIVDDPMDAKEINSLTGAAFEEVTEWWSNSWVSRINDPSRHADIVIMQRLHQRDLVQFLLDNSDGEWVHLCIPSEYEPRVMIPNPLGFVDPRKTDGELLWPERFDRKFIDSQKRPDKLGAYNFAAQHQQRPVPRGGGMFKSKHIVRYRNQAAIGDTIQITQSWDTAKSKKQGSAYSVCTTWAKTRRGYYLLDVYRERLDFPELVRAAIRKADEWKPNAVLIEDKANGTELLSQLRKMTEPEWRLMLSEMGIERRPMLNLIAVMPVAKKAVGDSKQSGGGVFYVQGDKEARAESVSALFYSGYVFFPENAPWLAVFEDELLNFPNSANKDQVDSMTQALKFMSESGIVISEDSFEPVVIGDRGGDDDDLF